VHVCVGVEGGTRDRIDRCERDLGYIRKRHAQKKLEYEQVDKELTDKVPLRSCATAAGVGVGVGVGVGTAAGARHRCPLACIVRGSPPVRVLPLVVALPTV
jgi:hypothetical protein